MAKPPVKAKKPKPVKGVEGQLRKGKFKKVGPKVAREIMELLRKRYPDADCELTYKNDFELLISVILSAQTTDANVNRVTPNLFKRFPTAKALAEAPIDEVKELIRSTGYYNAKAANIQACAKGIVERFNGKVPGNIEDLTTLPGVGRKTANVLLGVIHNIPGWTVDTHVQRLSKRLGFSEQEDPAKIEKELQILFPEQDWTKDSITLIWHGRRCCEARAPRCPECPVNHLCPSALV
jgi:endonuclease-3